MKIYNNSSDAFSNESPLKYQFQFRGCRFLMKIIKSKSISISIPVPYFLITVTKKTRDEQPAIIQSELKFEWVSFENIFRCFLE